MKVFIEDPRTGETLKRCSKCRQHKKLSEYQKHAGEKFGVESSCKDCTHKRTRVYKSKADRFWRTYYSKTIKIGQCLEWIGPVTKDDFPRCQWERKHTSVRRIVWLLSHGDVPDGLFVSVTCDNRRCVKQSHLELLTPEECYVKRCNSSSDLMASARNPARIYPERLARGDQHPHRLHPERVARGQRVAGAKLTEDIVRQIRMLYAEGSITLDRLAKQFGVTKSTTSRIVLRKTWAHVQ